MIQKKKSLVFSVVEIMLDAACAIQTQCMLIVIKKQPTLLMIQKWVEKLTLLVAF